MRTLVLKVDPWNPEPELISQAADIIKSGGLVAFPTETVYGLAANAFDLMAVKRVYEVKGRPDGRPLPVQVATEAGIFTLARDVPDIALTLFRAFSPGPLTVIMNASSKVPEMVSSNTGRIGIRIPDHPVALALIRAAQTPIVAPSANISDKPPATSADEVLGYFSGRIEAVLDAGTSVLKVASTVVDVTETPLKVIREGAIPRNSIMTAVGMYES